MEAFAYRAPTGLAEAIAILADAARTGQRAQVMAGGTDLLVQLRVVDRSPRTIVDIKRIPETTALVIGAREVIIGAAIKSAELVGNKQLAALYPGLIESLDLIGSTQIQGRASLGGNLCNASPAGDTIPALIACGAVCQIRGPNGSREMAVEDFVTGVQKNALAKDELLVALKLVRPAANSSDAYLRFIPRSEMDIAVVGVGVSLTLDGNGVCTAARVGIGAVAPRALLVPAAGAALIGTKVDAAALTAAGKACTAASSPISDKRGTAAYRRTIVAVLCRRAGQIALDRAVRARGAAA